MKKTIFAASMVTLFAGAAFAGSDNDHGADRLLNQQQVQSQVVTKASAQPVVNTATPSPERDRND
ncbi:MULTISPECIES: hypothetical protein [Leeia]|uniref:DUF680 domain-containing protein n=1 Tax=Leeia aquatica TaxID=2725557 RepID=A0A847RZU2_9NEIS|nr:hypothetical protein [Leeia aquatica]NLR76620.1 hypothetical protein [Leeia aquatica]